MTTSTEQITLMDRELRFGEHAYPFLVRSGTGALDELSGRLRALDPDRFVFVVDKGVPARARREVRECLREIAPVTVIEVLAGEQNKSPEAVTAIMAAALGSGVTRSSCVVCLGGGGVCNMAGDAAGRMLRGALAFVEAPTTLLAASDSAASLKQAVNLGAKNTDGLFKAPSLVLVNLDYLRSLPAAEVRSALCEAIKNAIAIAPSQVPDLRRMLRPDARYTDGEITRLIGLCLDAKQQVLRHDPHEEGPGLALEYGHTAGHAIELLTGLGHGLAIGVGGLVAARTARIMGILTGSLVEDMHEKLLTLNGAPVTVPPGLTDEALLSVLRRDNKRGYLKPRPGHIDMVLLKAPGVLHRTGGRPITQVPEDVLLRAIREREQS
jgi:3-dehydroquinate synthetase